MQGFDASTYGERFADVYDDWYGDLPDLDAAVATLAALAGDGAVLELGIGTGRVALPLVARGVEVHGIDASPAMVERLRAKPDGDRVPVHVGDFADVSVEVPGGFTVVLLAYNSLFNLPTEEAQRRCLAGAAGRLRPGGAVAVEAFVPSEEPDAPESSVTPARIGVDEVVLHVTRRDPATRTVAGSAVSITESGIRLRPWHIRYAAPDEIDAMAAAAGLTREARWGGWDGRPYDEECNRHVTVYRTLRE